MMETTRRAFVTASLCVLAGGAIYLVILRRQEGGGDTRYELKLADSFRDLDSVKLIGKAALEILPEERDIDRLITLIAPERDLSDIDRNIKAIDRYRFVAKIAILGSLSIRLAVEALPQNPRINIPPASGDLEDRFDTQGDSFVVNGD